MPRREISFVPGMYYHLYNRGNNRQAIFFQQENYLFFLRGIKRYVCPVAKVVAYCLMPTHYHMLVRVESPYRTSEFSKNSEVFLDSGVLDSEVCCSDALVSSASASESPVSRAMMRLSVSYTKAINKRFGRVGSLFQGQFQARYPQNYAHLLNLCVYIHANPVKDGLTTDPTDWMYSNYLEWLGQRTGSLVDRDFVSEHFGSSVEYQALVMDYIKSRVLPEEMKTYLQLLEN